ncbi:MAG: MarR family transcriptional regulator [Symbiobacteriaceae bacterium]|nr:MarR family transcriptional regulator [Symbiobacteriaceae bacterium]
MLLEITAGSDDKDDDHPHYDETVIELEDILRYISAVLRRQGRKIMEDYDITPPQHNALLQLHRYGNMTIGELSEMLYLAFSTATDLINRMERNGLVVRERDLSDRRVVRVCILDKGERVLDEVIEARRKYFARILQAVPKEEQNQLVRSLRKIDELISIE